MICNSTVTFLNSVLTLYTFYKSSTEFGYQVPWIYLKWMICFVTIILISVYCADRTVCEVNNSIWFDISSHFSMFCIRQGKMTSKILRDIMNSCIDSDISLSVSLVIFRGIFISRIIFHFYLNRQRNYQ